MLKCAVRDSWVSQEDLSGRVMSISKTKVNAGERELNVSEKVMNYEVREVNNNKIQIKRVRKKVFIKSLSLSQYVCICVCVCVALHEVTWNMVVWCTQDLRRDGCSFMWHQPCQRCKYTTSVDIQQQQKAL